MVTDSETTDVAAAVVAAGVGRVGMTEEDEATATVVGGVARAAVPAMGTVIGGVSFVAHPSLPRNWIDGRRANRTAVGNNMVVS